MKRLILAVVLAGVGFGPAFAANDYVYIMHNGEKERVKGLDMDKLSTCELKRIVADNFDLSIRKFDLKKLGGTKLKEDKKLVEQYLRHASTIAVVETSSSFQCT